LVIDASVALSWFLSTEDTDQALSLRSHVLENPQTKLLGPPTFWYEVTNVLWVATRRQRLNSHNAIKALEKLIDFEFTLWIADLSHCLKLSLTHNLAVYDTAYLDIAIDQEATLWTMDLRFKKAAESFELIVLP
jgi:predicted nucleic acid-binding protein